MSQLMVKKENIESLLKKGIVVKSKGEVEFIWKALSSECSPYENQPVTSTVTSQPEKKIIDIPSVTGNFKELSPSIDITIAFSLRNGHDLAELMKTKLEAQGVKVQFAQDPNTNVDLKIIEQRVASSHSLVVLLTAQCLRQLEVSYAMACAGYYYKHHSLVILVHDAGSCFFPGHAEQPPSLCDFFSEKAITFLECYADLGVSQVLEKYRAEKKALENIKKQQQQSAASIFHDLLNTLEQQDRLTIRQFRSSLEGAVPSEMLEELVKELDKNHDGLVDRDEFVNLYLNSPKFASVMEAKESSKNEEEHEDLTTRVFLSHKRSSGQAIVGRLYEGLKDYCSVFLDSEAKFKIHNLRQIVQHTGNLVFVLSAGIFLSRWCLEELKAALSFNKPVIVIRDLAFTMPEEVPPEWKEVEPLLRGKDTLIWMAEYNSACVEALKAKIGPSDKQFKGATAALVPRVLENLKNSGKLTLNLFPENCLAGILRALRDQHKLLNRLVELDLTNYVITTEDWTWIKNWDINLPPLTSFHTHRRDRGIDTAELIHFIANSGSKLQTLRLNTVTDKHLKLIGQKFPNLKDLLMWGFDGSEDGLEVLFENCKKIKNLRLDADMLDLSDEALKMIESGAPDLESLVMVDLNANFEALEEGFPNLRTFEFENTCLDEYPMDTLLEQLGAKCPNLESFEYSAVTGPYPSPEALTTFGQGCSKLQKLVVGFDMTEAHVEVIPTAFPNLQILDLWPSDGSVLQNSELEYIGQCKQLTEFSLHEVKRVTDEGLLHLLPVMPNLTKLYISLAPLITEDGIATLLKQASQLKSLTLNYCAKISTKVIEAIASNCGELESLVLNEIQEGFGDELTKEFSKLRKLKKLDFFLQDATDAAVHNLVPILPNLTDLCLRGCSTLTGDSALTVAKHGKNLEKLTMIIFKPEKLGFDCSDAQVKDRQKTKFLQNISNMLPATRVEITIDN